MCLTYVFYPFLVYIILRYAICLVVQTFHYFTCICSVALCQLEIKRICYVMLCIGTLMYQCDTTSILLFNIYQSNLRILSLFGLYNFTLLHLYSFADFSSVDSVHLHQSISTLLPLTYLQQCYKQALVSKHNLQTRTVVNQGRI